MVIELDDNVYRLDKEEGKIVKAIHSTFIKNEWTVITEDDYGDIFVCTMTEAELIEQYGEFPTD